MRHRGSEQTEDKYKGIPIDAAMGVHQAVVESLLNILPEGGRIADIGAGRGALSQRMSDGGFEVLAFDLDSSEWQASNLVCHEADVNTESGLSLVENHGPYHAIVSVEVIEHLENPRQYLQSLLKLARRHSAPIILSTPNPLDTFSAISFFRRGIFNWFSPAHYKGGGHISVLPYWLIDEHLLHLGVQPDQVSWKFLAPWKSPRLHTRMMYYGIQSVHRFLTRRSPVDYTSGQSAIVIVSSQQNA